MILCNSDENEVKEQEYLTTLYERNVDGLIVSPSPKIHSYLKKLSRNGMPLVLIDRTVKGLDVPSVTVDNISGAFQAVEHLINMGHSRIGMITGRRGIMTSDERFEGYRLALEKHGIALDENMIQAGDFRKDTAYEAALNLLEQQVPPTAVFISNETMAMGALLALKKKKIRIPDQISIISFGEPDWAALVEPSLSTVRQPMYTMGTLACESLLRKLMDPCEQVDRRDKSICMKPELVIRKSCN